MSGQHTGPWPAPDWRLKARAVLADRLPVVVAAFLLLAGVGAALTVGAVVAPGTTTETRTVDSWQTTTDYGHAATVREQNPVYPVGSTLSNRSVYFRSVAPILDGNATASYAAEQGELHARTTLTLVLRASDGQQTLWEVTERRTQESATLAPGESLRVPFSLNVTKLHQRVQRIEQSLGSSGRTTVALRARTVYRGTVEGREVNATVTRTLTLDVEGSLYYVDGGSQQSTTHRRTKTVTVTKPAGPLELVGGPVLLLVGLAAAVGAVKAGREDILELTVREEAMLERAEFEEWVTIGTVPDDPPGEAVAVASLEGLVDLAADTNSRILQDAHLGHYVVLAEDVHYVYEPLGREGL